MASQVSQPYITYSRSPLLSQCLSKETLFTRILHHVLAERFAFDGLGAKRYKWRDSASDRLTSGQRAAARSGRQCHRLIDSNNTRCREALAPTSFAVQGEPRMTLIGDSLLELIGARGRVIIIVDGNFYAATFGSSRGDVAAAFTVYLVTLLVRSMNRGKWTRQRCSHKLQETMSFCPSIVRSTCSIKLSCSSREMIRGRLSVSTTPLAKKRDKMCKFRIDGDNLAMGTFLRHAQNGTAPLHWFILSFPLPRSTFSHRINPSSCGSHQRSTSSWMKWPWSKMGWSRIPCSTQFREQQHIARCSKPWAENLTAPLELGLTPFSHLTWRTNVLPWTVVSDDPQLSCLKTWKNCGNHAFIQSGVFISHGTVRSFL